jgi:hypothetical protein
MPPRVFCKKRLDFLDYKGVDFFGEAKRLQEIEGSRVKAGTAGSISEACSR